MRLPLLFTEPAFAHDPQVQVQVPFSVTAFSVIACDCDYISDCIMIWSACMLQVHNELSSKKNSSSTVFAFVNGSSDHIQMHSASAQPVDQSKAKRHYPVTRFALRTKLIDDQILDALSVSKVSDQQPEPIQQVVVLGAGMDTRAWRMDLPEGDSLCYAVSAVLRCAALCCAALCCAVLCCAVLCCAVLCCYWIDAPACCCVLYSSQRTLVLYIFMTNAEQLVMLFQSFATSCGKNVQAIMPTSCFAV